MRIQFPIQYEIDGVKTGNRVASRYAYRELVEVDIREMAEAHAPVAVEWRPRPLKSPHRHATSDCNVSGPDGVQLTRWHDGRHWQRLCEGHFSQGMHRGALVSARRFEELLLDPSRRGDVTNAMGMRLFQGTTVPRRTKWHNADSDPTDQFRSMKWDGRADAMIKLEKTVNGLMSIDGVLYRRSFEPYLSVIVLGRMETLPIREIGIEAKESARWNAKNAHAMLSLNDWDAAVAFALGDERPTAEITSVIESVRPQVHMPETLSYDWKVCFMAAEKIVAMMRQMAVMLVPEHPALRAVVESVDADEQYELLTSIDEETVNAWKARGVTTKSYWEALEKLEDRTISLTSAAGSHMRP
ncbi:hypothetical protein O9X98_05885 [Agrobacterium salinitolerans]|nr:hypothetical protein [Agrobacterium salinitolerans]